MGSPVQFASLAMNSSFGSYACGLDAQGGAYCWGTILVNFDLGHVLGEVPTALGGGVSLTMISTGVEHICGVATTHEVLGRLRRWPAGRSDDRVRHQLRHVRAERRGRGLEFVHIAAGQLGTCGLTTGGQAFCWGSNAYGALGDPSATVQQNCGLAPAPCAPGPVPVANGQQFTAISGAGSHVCARTAGGEVWCWGRNDLNQIGGAAQSTELCADLILCVRQPELAFASGVSFASVSAGGSSTCGVDQNHVSLCWGDNSSGQVGNGGGIASVPVQVLGEHLFTSVAVAADHACGLTLEGEALCWGQNAAGQLGTGDQQDSNEPVPVVGPAAD